jgi:hypothetical protein
MIQLNLHYIESNLSECQVLMDMYLVLFLITFVVLLHLLLGMKIYLLLFMVLGLCYISL